MKSVDDRNSRLWNNVFRCGKLRCHSPLVLNHNQWCSCCNLCVDGTIACMRWSWHFEQQPWIQILYQLPILKQSFTKKLLKRRFRNWIEISYCCTWVNDKGGVGNHQWNGPGLGNSVAWTHLFWRRENMVPRKGTEKFSCGAKRKRGGLIFWNYHFFCYPSERSESRKGDLNRISFSSRAAERSIDCW